MAWNSIREPYQPHIRALTQYINHLSEQHVRTGDPFFLEEYHSQIQALQRLKQWIVDQENAQK